MGWTASWTAACRAGPMTTMWMRRRSLSRIPCEWTLSQLVSLWAASVGVVCKVSSLRLGAVCVAVSLWAVSVGVVCKVSSELSVAAVSVGVVCKVSSLHLVAVSVGVVCKVSSLHLGAVCSSCRCGCGV